MKSGFHLTAMPYTIDMRPGYNLPCDKIPGAPDFSETEVNPDPENQVVHTVRVCGRHIKTDLIHVMDIVLFTFLVKGICAPDIQLQFLCKPVTETNPEGARTQVKT